MKKIKIDIRDFKDINWMSDFYNILEEKYKIKSKYIDKGFISHVCQIEMNDIDCKKLLNYMKKNWKKSKAFKHCRKSYADTVLSLDWADLSPKSGDVEAGYIVLKPKYTLKSIWKWLSSIWRKK